MKKGILGVSMALCALTGCGQPATEATANDGAAEDQAIETGTETSRPTVVLTADGIMTDGTPGSLVGFGANSLDTIEAVSAIAGEMYDQDASDECGAGPMEFANWGPIMLSFQQGEFAGWELRDGASEASMGLTNGATIGSPRADLEAALGGPLAIEESTLGFEFYQRGISGLLSADTPDATVTALWAGTSCVMR